MLVLHLTSQKTNSQKEHSLTIWLPYLFLDLCVFVDVNEIFPLCPTETIGCNMLLKTTTRQFAAAAAQFCMNLMKHHASSKQFSHVKARLGLIGSNSKIDSFFSSLIFVRCSFN